jgi:DNA-directed RNA polymerase sigma subunit (sigma70/sigma32)
MKFKFEEFLFPKKALILTSEEREKRRGEMYELRRAGKTLQFIGNIYNLSRQRVLQILNHK